MLVQLLPVGIENPIAVFNRDAHPVGEELVDQLLVAFHVDMLPQVVAIGNQRLAIGSCQPSPISY